MRFKGTIKKVAIMGLVLTGSIQWGASAVMYTITDLDTLGGTFSTGYGINDSGQVTGLTIVGGGFHAFLHDGTTMHDLGALGSNGSFGYGINNNGYVTGRSDAALSGNSRDRAFLSDGSPGGMIDLGTLGGWNSVGLAINDSAQVTGWAAIAGGQSHAFLSDGTPGGMIDLGTFGGTYSVGNAINNGAQVTGRAATAGGQSHAFLYDADTMVMTDLGTLGGTYSVGNAINDGGQVTGRSDLAGNGGSYAFLYDDATMMMTNLGALGGNFSEGLGVNNSGMVVGHYYTTGIGTRPFLYDASQGGMLDLNDLIAPLSGWTLNEAYDINNFGQITGLGSINGQQHAFLLTPDVEPVPEPATMAILGCLGAGMFGSRKLKRKQA